MSNYDKSQSFSESTEALGGVLLEAVSLICSLPMILAPTMINIEQPKKGIWKFASTLGIPMAAMIALSVLITKEQRNASRVANMQAIKELDDYRYFADANASKADKKN